MKNLSLPACGGVPAKRMTAIAAVPSVRPAPTMPSLAAEALHALGRTEDGDALVVAERVQVVIA
jgi:hypothetical protein